MAQWTRLIIALLIAVWAQKVVSTGQHLLDGLILFGAAAALFVANVPAPQERVPENPGTVPCVPGPQDQGLDTVQCNEKSRTALSPRALGLAGLAVGLTAIAVVLLWSRLSSPLGLALWLGGLLLFLVALWPAPRQPAPAPQVSVRLEVFILVFIVLAAFLVRASALETIPNGLQSDEGNNGLEALKWLSGAPYSPYAETNEGQATLFTYLIALSLKMFGVSVPSMRLVSAVAGTLTVAAFYALAREVIGPRAGLVGTGLLAASRWHLTFSRIIYELILVPFCAVWLFYFLHRGLRDGRRRDFVLAGYALALGLNTYTAFRIIPLGVALLSVYWLLSRRRRFWANLRGLGLFALSGVRGLIPLAIYTIQRPEVVLIRTKHISVFSDIQRAGSLEPLWSNVRKYLLMFNVQGDGASLNNLPGAPMLDLVVGALFILGLAYALWHWRQPRMFLPLAWTVGVLPAGILSVGHEAPSARRVIGLVPVVYLLAVVVVDALWSASLHAWRGRGRRVWAFGFGALAAAVGVSNLLTFFTVQAGHPSVWRAFSPHEAAIGHYMARLEHPALLYLSSNFNKHSAITFIAHDPDYVLLDLSRHLPVREPQETDVIYIMEPADRRLEPLFHQFYPTGVWQEYRDPYGGLLFNTFQVTPAQQVEAMGLNARYYPNAGWRSPAALVQRDRAIAFDWHYDPPLPYPFSVEWRGALLVPRYGQYDLTIQASGPVTLTLDGEVLSSGGKGRVLAGGFHDFNLRYAAETSAGDLVLLWEGPVGGRQIVPASSFYTFEVPEFGLVGYYYPNPRWEGSPRVVQRDIFLTAGEVLRSPYSIIWRGKLLVERPGLYKLGTNSDDGSLLYVDGRLVVDNGGPHGARYVEGSINLTAGYHDVELRYFQDGGSRALDLWWTLPDGRKELIPPTNLLPWEGEVAAWQQQAEPFQVEAPSPGVLADQVWQTWTYKTEGDEGTEMEPRGVAVNPLTGWVYVADPVHRCLQAFDAGGELLFTFGGDADLQEPGDLVVDSKGDVYVLDPPSDAVVHFTADGQFVARFGESLRLFRPRGIGLDRFDRLYIADTGGSRVLVVSTAGEELASWGGPGAGPGQFNQPTDVAVGPDGQVYVADTFNQRVQWLDADGAYLGEWLIQPANTYDSPHLVVSPAHVLYVTSPEESHVLAYDLAGRFLGQFGGPGAGPGQFLKPVAIAVDAAGRLYVTDPLQGRVQGFQAGE